MAMTIKQLLDFSWMSQAAYLDFSGLVQNDSEALIDKLKTGTINAGNIFAPGQATTFTDPTNGFNFISHMPNDWTGFSATVFESNTDGSYTISVRGTEPTLWHALPDLVWADGLGVVIAGQALPQLIQAFRYYKQITTPAGQDVQYTVAELDMLGQMEARILFGNYGESLLSDAVNYGIAAITTEMLNDKGLGELIPAGATINFTGHSMGGHLAYLLADMVAQSRGPALVGDVVTYNAPGQNALPYEILNWISEPNSTDPTGTIGSKHVAIMGEGGLNVTAGLGQVVGTPQNIFIEDSGAIAGNFLVENHSIVKLSDSLAVYNLFAQLDPSLDDATADNLSTITDILKAQTGNAANTLEVAVGALGKLFNVADTVYSGNAFDGAGRDKLYKAVDAIGAVLPTDGSLSLITIAPATLLADASALDADGQAHRYSLVNLNPFAVLGADYSAHNTNGELHLYNPATGHGQLTPGYLTDRAAMLRLMIQRNMDDSSTISGDIFYRDVELRITLRPGSLFVDADAMQQVVFGGAGNNPLTGGDNHDRLYGMGGIDTLNGGGGNDYLEGGSDDDKLNGGIGTDTYTFNTGDGADTITDVDGLGTIMLNGAQVMGQAAVYQGDNTWAGGNTTYKYDRKGSLTITSGSDSITINNFNLANATDPIQGYLGIHLAQRVSIVSGAGNTGFALANQSADVPQGALQTFTVSVAAALDTAQSLTLQLSNAAASLWKLITGAETLSFADDSTVQITIPAGQDSVSLALLDTTNTNQVDTATLTVSFTDANGTAITSNTLAVTFDNPNPNAGNGGTPDYTYNCNFDLLVQTASVQWDEYHWAPDIRFGPIDPSWDIIGVVSYDQATWMAVVKYHQRDAAGNYIRDTSKPNQNSSWTTAAGTSGNDYLLAPVNSGGNLYDGTGGNDILIGSTGFDYIGAFGNGDNLIVGNGAPPADPIYNLAGEGVIVAGNGNNRIYANTQVDLATALAQQKTLTPTGQSGVFIAAGTGHNTIVGGTGNDLIISGGNSLVVLGPGNNTFLGGTISAGNAGDYWWTKFTSSVSVGGNMPQYELSIPIHSFFQSSGGFTPSVQLAALQSYGQYNFDKGWRYDGWVSTPTNPSFMAVSSSNPVDLFDGYSALDYPGLIYPNTPAGNGSDTIFGGGGNSLIIGSNGGNWIDVGGGNSNVFSGGGDDTIFCSTGNSLINGQGGNDYINGESGNHRIWGGAGDNIIYGGSGDDIIFAGIGAWNWADINAGNNYVNSGSGNVTLYGSGGNDTLVSGSLRGTGKTTTIYAGNGDETIVGGDGNDTIIGGAGTNTIYTGDGNAYIQLSSNATETSTVYGGNGTYTIVGGAGDDLIYAGDGGTVANYTYVSGGDGDNTLVGGAGFSYLFGGSGTDLLIAGSGSSFLKGGSGTETLYASTGIATLIAGTGTNTLYGGSGTDTLQGGSGSNTFVAGSGNERIIGGSGHNTYRFNSGFGNVELINARSADTFEFDCDINLNNLTFTAGFGSNGSAALVILSDNGGRLVIDGGLDGSIGGYVFLDPVTMSLDEMLVQGDSIPVTVAGADGNLIFSAAGNETLVGGTGNDIIYGWGGNDTLIAGSGNQTLYAKTGNNTVIGGAGNNTLVAGSGNDTLISGAGIETLVGGTGNATFVVNNTADIVRAQSTGSNTNTVMSLVDYVVPENVQILILTGTADLTATGNAYDNTITANDGNDTLIGGTGHTTLIGGSGNDLLIGGSNMVGSGGNDRMFAGMGGATFQIDPATVGTALIGGAGKNLLQLYQDMGVDDWQVGYEHGGMYFLNDTSQGGWFADEQAVLNAILALNNGDWSGTIQDAMRNGDVTYCPPLPVLFSTIGTDGLQPSAYYANNNVPVVDLPTSANDFPALASIYAQGILPAHTVAFGEGVTATNLQLSWGQTVGSISGLATDTQQIYTTLNISWGTDGQSIQVMITHADDPFGSGVSGFTFADGTMLSMAQMVAMAPPAPSFDPGAFVFQPGMGSQEMDGSYDSIRFVAGITAGNIQLLQQGTDLLITYGTQGDSALIQNFTDSVTGDQRIAQFRFADGSQGSYTNDGLGNANMEAYDANGNLVGGFWQNSNGNYGNNTYRADGSSSGKTCNPDGSYYTYTDDGYGTYNELDYGADGRLTGDYWERADGSNGEDTFNADGTSNGTTYNPDYSFSSYTNDGHGNIHTLNYGSGGALLSDNWSYVNIAPVVGMIAGQAAIQDAAFAFQIPAGSFTDVNTDDTLTYDATLADGNPLPSWLSFDADTQTFSGTPGNADVGNLNLLVTATDTGGLGASSAFALNVANVNDAPTVAVPLINLSAQKYQPFSFSIPANTFSDADLIYGDTLAFSATLADGSALPAWLSFDAATQTFSGTPSFGDAGNLSVAVIATDLGGLSATTNFVLDVTVTNMAPITSPIADQVTNEDAPFSFTVPVDAFADPNPGDTLAYSATLAEGTALPSWLSFDATTQTFSGTPTNWDVSALSVTVTAIDSGGLSASSNFALEVLNVNDAPTVVSPLQDQSSVAGQAFSFAATSGAVVVGSFMNDATDTGAPDQVWPNYDRWLSGSGGNDTYSFARGDGNVRISDWDNAPMDTVQLADVLPADVSVQSDQWGNVVLSVNGTTSTGSGQATDSLTLGSWLYSDEPKIEQISFADGTVWGVNDIQSMLSTAPTTGNDYITGTDGNDIIDALAGDDRVFGGEGNDVLQGGDGNDYLIAGAGDNTLLGGTGFDYLEGNAGNDMLGGGDGSDYLYGSDGNDTLDGGAGNDELEDGSGNDTYLFGRGSGQDVVYEWDDTPGNVDTVQFAADVLHTDVSVTQGRWGSVVLSINGTTDSLTLDNWLNYDACKVEQFVFSDGTVWGVNEVMAMISASPTNTITSGNDSITGTVGNDTIKALAGDDEVFGGAGDDVLLGGAGYDELQGGGGSDILDGGSSSDWIEADNSYSDLGNDLLAGGAGNDDLEASISNDLMIGNTGNDYIYGDDGNNVILFNRGDGNDWIEPWSSGVVPKSDTVSLGGGIGYTDLSFSRDGDSLILDTGPSTGSGQVRDSITFEYWFATWGDNFKAVNRLQVVAAAMVGFDAQSSDPLLNQRIQQFDFVGLANQFEADLAADPTITTWQLAPHLADFSLGGSDTSAIGGDMAYLYGMNGNLNGLSEADLRSQLTDAQFGIGAQALTPLAPAAVSTFADVDAIHGDTLTYSATLADGSALPAWLNFDAATQTFSGTPTQAINGNMIVSVIATDTGGLTASNSFMLTVTGGLINLAPFAANDTVAMTDGEGAAVISQAQLLANDIDPDAGDTLNLTGFDAVTAQGNTVTQDTNGDLVLDIGNNYQSLGAGQAATDTFSYTIADAAGATSNATVTMTINGVNDAPVAANAIVGQTSQQDAAFSFTVPADAFIDIDQGDVLTYNAALADGSALPSWMAFDAATQTFSGTPGNWDVGGYSVTVTATDTGGFSASSIFAVEVSNINDAPAVSIAVADQSTLEDQPFTFAVPANTFDDVDFIHGDTIIYSATLADGTALPTWLAFDAVTCTFSGTPTNWDAGILDVAVTATDTGGLSASNTFALDVLNMNDAPTVANALTDQATLEDAPFSFTVPAGTFGDVDFIHGDTITYSTTLSAGTALPSWLMFDAATQTFSGTPGNAEVGSLNLVVTATDTGGLSASNTFALNVANVNDTPTASADAGAATEDGGAVTLSAATLLANDTDPDSIHGDILNIVGVTQAASGATVTLVNGDVQYDIGNLYQSLGQGQAATETFSYTVSDTAGATSTAQVTMGITGANDAPLTAADDAAAIQEDGTIFATGNVLANDTDVDQGTLLTVANAGVFAGQYGQLTLAADGSYSYTLDNASLAVQSLGEGQTVTETFAYQATDGMVATPSTLTVTITGTNDAPVTAVDVAAVQEDVALMSTGNVLANDSDVDQRTILSVADAGIRTGNYGQLTLNADGSYSYSLDNASLAVQSLAAGQVVTETFGYEATDGLTATPSTLTVTITGTNDAPVTAIPLTGQAATKTGAFSYQLPTGAFTDIDQGDKLTYSATLSNGSVLPTWLTFDANNQVFSSNMPDGAAGLWDISVTATDTSGASATSAFRLDVANLIKGTSKEDNLAGTSPRDVMYGLGDDDKLSGGNADDVLVGGSGNDVLEGGAGNDTLIGGVPVGNSLAGAPVPVEAGRYDRHGEDSRHDDDHDRPENNLLNGGAGNDILIGANGNDLLIGGIGNDTLNTGPSTGSGQAGADIIAFNRGDGQDVVLASMGADNTVSLGGGIKLSDLAFSHVGNDLILETGPSTGSGQGEQITFLDWYASLGNHSIANLQIIGNDLSASTSGKPDNKTIRQFDFSKLVASYDQAVAANSTTDHWALTNAMLDKHLEHSSGGALGGDLAWQYGMNGTLAMVSLNAAQDILDDNSFGSKPQHLHMPSKLKDGVAMLG
ncbi:MAG: putative Ig domain-containing protein [Gallionella sp.]|nr:putative Ig domain-containing protein [Gallionella sp.]